MILAYRLLFPVLALLLWPYYLRRMLRRGGYGHHFFYRLGFWPNLPQKEKDTKRIWIQAVSVGELSSIQKLVTSLSQSQNIEIVISSTTSTGLAYAEKVFGDSSLAIGPFPLDWWPISCLAWNKIAPDLVISIDSELWPEHFEQGRLRGVPVYILNARLSDRTYSRLSQSKIARNFLLPKGLEILTTSERQKARWLELGINENHLHITGNLKVDSALYQKVCPDQKIALKHEFGFLSESLVLAGISTWPGEESLLVETVLKLGNAGFDARLLLVPRHAERRSEITKILEKSGLPFHLRSHRKQAPPGTVVYLADTTGELAQLIHSADIGLMGKTLPPNRGGQNPIEPISIGLPLVIGPNYQNFQETCHDLLVDEALAETSSLDEGVGKLVELATSISKREKLSSNAHNWRKKQGSPTALSLARIYQALEINQE